MFCLLAAPLGMNAQTLVFHHVGGEKTTVTLPATFTVTPTDDKLVIDDGDGNVVELSKDDVMCVTYRDAKGDVNGDQRVDVADVSTLVGLLISKGEEEKVYLTCPDDHHPHLIDLGLPSDTKWACCNVGASKPEDYGGYYAWGETEEKDTYDWSSYIHCDGSDDHDIHDIGSDIAGTQYDAATANWGGSWVMPSVSQINELLNNTTSEWTTQNGIIGRKFTGSNDGTIFLPAAGRRCGGELGEVGEWDNYWSSTLCEWTTNCAMVLRFSDNVLWDSISGRCDGSSVRPVRKNGN